MRRKKPQTLMVIVNLGLLASAASIGGLVNKMVGRIGDTPIIGAWTYANNLCAVSATAKAEAIIRGTVARDVAALMEFKGVSLIEAADYVAVVEEGAPKGNVGLVAVSAVGEVTIYDICLSIPPIMASVSLGVDQEIISTFPKDTGWAAEHYYQYQNFWYPQVFLEGVIWAQQDFRARDSDIFLATFPKCGTTWVKALMIAIKNRKDCDYSSHPLLTKNPHDIVPYIELIVHQDNPVEYLDSMASPRLLASHIPHSSLPNSLLDSDTRVVYVARNPKDVLVSFWAFSEKLRSKVYRLPPLSLEEGFELFCKGVALAGPFWDHVQGYWEASLKNPNKVLFFKFEDLKADTEGCVRRLAEFIGYPFSSEEEKEGAVQEIIKFCSFENLSSLEVNKSGTYHVGPKTDEKFSNDVFFRRGETGDSQKHLTPEMLERLDKITEQKFGASGLKF